MIDTSVFKEFTTNINTVDKLNELLSDVAEAETASFASSAKNFIDSIKGKVSNNFFELTQALEARNKLPTTPEERREFFEKLKNYLQKFPRISLELAFNPTEKFVNKISKFLKSDNDSSPILDIKVRTNILAGTTIEKDGVYKDYSYATKLVQVLKQKYLGRTDENV